MLLEFVLLSVCVSVTLLAPAGWDVCLTFEGQTLGLGLTNAAGGLMLLCAAALFLYVSGASHTKQVKPITSRK